MIVPLNYLYSGAPRQNRTAITGLQNQCTAIVLVGRKLAVSVGFEPTARITTNNTLAGCRFKPLIQLTILTSSPIVLCVSKPLTDL